MIKYLLITSALIVCGLVPQPASAHVLKTDGTIGVVLHLTPDDDPIIGQPANFFFDFKDKNNQFKLSQCNCKITIEKDGKSIHEMGLMPMSPEANQAQFSFVFPEKGVYKVTVSGSPLNGAQFVPFNLIYDERVAREDGQRAGLTLGIRASHYIIAGIMIVFVMYALFKQSTQNKPKGTK